MYFLTILKNQIKKEIKKRKKLEIEPLFENIKEELIKKKLIELLKSSITHYEILTQFTDTEITIMLKNKKLIMKPTLTPTEILLSYLTKEQLIGFLREKKLSYEDEIRSIETTKHEELIDLLDIKTLNELKNKVMEIKENEIFPLVPLRPVNDIEVLPQIDTISWFNALLMVLLYSEGIRKVIIQEVAKWIPEEINGNKFKEFVVYVLKYNYTEPEKIKELFRKKFKTSSLLLSLLRDEQSLKTLKDDFKSYFKINVDDYGYQVSSFLLKDYFLSLLLDNYSFVYYNGKQTKTVQTFNNPKIVIVLHSYFNLLIQHLKAKEFNFSLFSTLLTCEGIAELQETITINGIKYKLDACTSTHYKPQTYPYVISGITYNKNPYVYNGLAIKKEELSKEKYYYKNKHFCPLFTENWKASITEKKSKPFCFNITKCEIHDDNDKKKDTCYDFYGKNTETILFYVREDEYETETLTLEQEVAKEKLQYNSLSLSSLVKSFHKIREDSYEDLHEKLIELYGKQIITELTQELLNTNNYSIFYFILCNSILKEDKDTLTKQEILKKFYIALLESYIKKNRIFDFGKTSKDLIGYYITVKTLEELLKRIGYTDEEINKLKNHNDDDYSTNENYLLLWYFLEKNKSTYKEINRLISLRHLLLYLVELYISKKIKLNVLQLYDKQLFLKLFELYDNTFQQRLDESDFKEIKEKLAIYPILNFIKRVVIENETIPPRMRGLSLHIIPFIYNFTLKDLLRMENITS